MKIEQMQLLIPEGELVRIAFDNASYWTIYEGVVDGEDSFVRQHYSRGYPTRMLNSFRCERDNLEFDSGKKTVSLGCFRLERYDIDNSRNERLTAFLVKNGIFEEPLGRQ